ncbi:MAG: hypothetical protein LBV80_08150 [Deltaproteobacteria bacterium]|nr:hypothetical protein [Deltaproteobacteria bacterium]
MTISKEERANLYELTTRAQASPKDMRRVLAALEQAERERDTLANVLMDCPDNYFDEGEHLIQGQYPSWCAQRWDDNGEPLGCGVTDSSKCWLEWAR